MLNARSRNFSNRAALLLLLMLFGLFCTDQHSEANCKQVLSRVTRVSKTLSAYVIGQPRRYFHFYLEEGTDSRAGRLMADLGNPLLRTVILGLIPSWDSPLNGVFRRQWNGKPLTPDDLRLLVKFAMVDTYWDKQTFMDKHPRWTSFRRKIDQIGDLGFKAIALLVANHLLHLQGTDDESIDAEDYFFETELQPSDEEIQLLIESVPFPHLAIRVGNNVYSYGQTHLSRSPVSAYVNARAHQEILEQDEAAEETTRDPGSADRSVTWGAAKLGLATLPRTLQVITLTIGKQERDRVKRYLELQVAKRYHNRTLVNDCSTMTMRALGTENAVYDPSPSLVAMMMSLRKTLGDKTVGKVFQVSIDQPEKGQLMALRNAYINYIDGALTYVLVPFNLPERLHLDATYSSEQLQHYDPSTQKVIESWRADVSRVLDTDDEIIFYQSRVKKFLELAEDDPTRESQRERLVRLINRYFDGETARAMDEYTSPEVPMKTYYLAKYKLELMSVYKNEMLEALQAEGSQ